MLDLFFFWFFFTFTLHLLSLYWHWVAFFPSCENPEWFSRLVLRAWIHIVVSRGWVKFQFGVSYPFKWWKEHWLRTHLTPLLYSYTCYAVLCSWQNEMFLFGLLCSKYFDRELSSSAVPIYTGPPVTQSASIISVITRQALASMRRMPEGIVWRTASTVLLLTGHMISDLQSTISGDTRSKYWPVSSGCQTFHRPAA